MLFKVILVGLLLMHRVNSMRFGDTDNKKHCVKFERGGVSSQWSKLKRWFSDWSAPLTGTSEDIQRARAAMPAQHAQASRRSRGRRMTDGTFIDITETPWVISFSLPWDQFCSGSIVTEEHIITDAYCVTKVYNNVYGIKTYTFIGADRYTIRVGSSFRKEFGYTVYPKRICVSPRYLKRISYNEGRVAVITLTEKLKFGKTVQPIPFHPPIEITNQKFDVVGFGDLEPNVRANASVQLHKIKALMMPISNCSALVKGYGSNYPEESICTLFAGPRTCPNDFGNSLYNNLKLLGVSYHFFSCIKNLTSRFTRLDQGYSRNFVEGIIESDYNGATQDTHLLVLTISLCWASLICLFCQ